MTLGRGSSQKDPGGPASVQALQEGLPARRKPHPESGRLRGHVLFWAILIPGLLLDLLTKSLVFSCLEKTPSKMYVLIPRLLNFTMDINTGGPFSIFSGNPGWLALATVAALVIIGYLYLGSVRTREWMMVVALGMIAGGAFGNLFDRLYLGHVRDFVQFWIGNWPYPTFNLADILICVGAGLILIALIRSGRAARKVELAD